MLPFEIRVWFIYFLNLKQPNFIKENGSLKRVTLFITKAIIWITSIFFHLNKWFVIKIKFAEFFF